jgi:glutathione peroxidase
MLSIKNIPIKLIDGSILNWNLFENKHLLFVNVASECGYTSQYQQLQELYEFYKDKLEIIALPCNDFGHQEPGTEAEIQRFCQVNYGVNFTITEKVNILSNPHPLIKFLCQSGSEDFKIDWNFNKVFVDKEGSIVGQYRSSVGPLDDQIINHLN